MDSTRLDALPTGPGVYHFRDQTGASLYVGKAKNLRSRVRSYFRSDPGRSIRLEELVRRVEEVETIVVGSEAEALILEANLIKEHRPRFNIHLRDDKRYPYVKVTVQEPFPRVFVTRRLRNDGARYFGPYTSVGPLRQALEALKRIHYVRSCRYDLPADAPARPCLDHHIGRCLAPCVGLQDQEDYRKRIDRLVDVLDGDTMELRAAVAREMEEAAGALRFEEAARHRDVLEGLEALEREQRAHQVSGGDQDVLGVARDGEDGTAVVLRIRKGVLLGRESHRFKELEGEGEGELLNTFTPRYYLGRGTEGVRDLPREILVPADFEDRELLASVLSERAGRKVSIHRPQRGPKRRLVELAGQNARHLLEEAALAREGAETVRADDLLYELQDRLDLKMVPRLMACVDISHFQGSEVVGSVVVFEGGRPRKSEYRRMRVRGDWRNDDYRSLAEVVARYLRRRLEEEKPLPELVVVDGGRGQLTAVRRVLDDRDLADVELAALAKREEEIFRPGRREVIRLSRRDPALRLLQRIRDEAHRFAVQYSRKLRTTRTLSSALEGIPGVGSVRRQSLLSRFGSVRGVTAASPDELARTPGISHTLARRIQEHLRDGPPEVDSNGDGR